MKKSFILKESRGRIINDLDQAIEHGYKVELSYLNKPTGNIVTRSVYIFSRGITSKGKMCYRAFQYDPYRSNFQYKTKKDHGWRLFDVENISNYRILNKKSKLWINGELPNWLSKINREGDKMFTQTFKIMDIDLFIDKHGRGNLSVKKRREALEKQRSQSKEDPNQNPQLGLFDDPELDGNGNSIVRNKRKTQIRNKKDNSSQTELDFGDDTNVKEPNIIKKKDLKPQPPQPKGRDMEEQPPPTNQPEDNEFEEEDEIEDIDQIKESRILTKKDLLWTRN